MFLLYLTPTLNFVPNVTLSSIFGPNGVKWNVKGQVYPWFWLQKLLEAGWWGWLKIAYVVCVPFVHIQSPSCSCTYVVRVLGCCYIYIYFVRPWIEAIK